LRQPRPRSGARRRSSARRRYRDPFARRRARRITWSHDRAEVLGASPRVGVAQGVRRRAGARGPEPSARARHDPHRSARPSSSLRLAGRTREGFEERAIAAYEAAGAPTTSLWKPLAGLAQARRALDKKPTSSRCSTRTPRSGSRPSSPRRSRVRSATSSLVFRRLSRGAPGG